MERKRCRPRCFLTHSYTLRDTFINPNLVNASIIHRQSGQMQTVCHRVEVKHVNGSGQRDSTKKGTYRPTGNRYSPPVRLSTVILWRVSDLSCSCAPRQRGYFCFFASKKKVLVETKDACML